jgi:hypothetical protein
VLQTGKGLTLGAFHDRPGVPNHDHHDAMGAAFRGSASALMLFPNLLPAVPLEVADKLGEGLFRCLVCNLDNHVGGAERNPLLAQLDRRLESSALHRAGQVFTFLSSIVRCTRRPDDDVGHPEKATPQEAGI